MNNRDRLRSKRQKKTYPAVKLFEVDEKVRCLSCGHKGAVKFYGNWYPNGLGDEADSPYLREYLGEYRDKPYMSGAVGFGGVVPWQCTNCGNKGLINIGGLEGYRKAFETIDPSPGATGG